MASDLPDGPFALVYVATNTFFGLVLGRPSSSERSCNVAARLADGGGSCIDAFVPDDPPRSTSIVEVQKVSVDGVVIAVSDADIAEQMAWGQMVEISEDGIRMRPWQVRYSTPAELDAMAAAAGLARGRAVHDLGEGCVHRRQREPRVGLRTSRDIASGGRLAGAMSGLRHE